MKTKLYEFDVNTLRTINISCIDLEFIVEDVTIAPYEQLGLDTPLLHNFFEHYSEFTPFETLNIISDLLSKGKVIVKIEVAMGQEIELTLKVRGLIANETEQWDFDDSPYE
jgi:hypothetical protein